MTRGSWWEKNVLTRTTFFFQWSEARTLYHPSQVQQFSSPPYPCQICNHRGFFFLFISAVNETVQYYLHPLFFLLECPKYIPYFWRYRLAVETNYRNHVDGQIFFWLCRYPHSKHSTVWAMPQSVDGRSGWYVNCTIGSSNCICLHSSKQLKYLAS